MQFNIAHPDIKLSPNYHAHWTKKHAAKKQAQHEGYYLAKTIKHNLTQQCRLKAVISASKDHDGRYDIDNIVASLKPFFDGLFKGLKLNDEQIDIIVVKKLHDTKWHGVMIKLERIAT
jgi:Holliday junction resolvase RusA-like endonuclease